MMTVTEYALKHGISKQTTHWRIKRGKVKAQKVGSVWIIEDEPELFPGTREALSNLTIRK